jgi:putative oxidoreductase
MPGTAVHISCPPQTIGFWLLKILLAALFIFAGGAKLAGLPAMIDVFERVGFRQ